MTRYQQLLEWEQGNVKEGDVFRCWITSLANGREVWRWQRLSRGNPCKISASQIREDYSEIGQWGQSWNNVTSASCPAVRVHNGHLTNVAMDDALAAIRE